MSIQTKHMIHDSNVEVINISGPVASYTMLTSISRYLPAIAICFFFGTIRVGRAQLCRFFFGQRSGSATMQARPLSYPTSTSDGSQMARWEGYTTCRLGACVLARWMSQNSCLSDFKLTGGLGEDHLTCVDKPLADLLRRMSEGNGELWCLFTNTMPPPPSGSEGLIKQVLVTLVGEENVILMKM